MLKLRLNSLDMQLERNGPLLWEQLLEIVGHHWSPCVAGGAIRDFFLRVPCKDVDIFVPGLEIEDFTSIIESLPEKFCHGRVIWPSEEDPDNPEFLSENAIHDEGYREAEDLIGVWEGEIVGLPVNIICRKSLNNGPKALVSTFDFNVVKGWMESDGAVRQSPAMAEDLKHKRATLAHARSYDQSLRRFASFNARNPGKLALVDNYARRRR